MSWNSSFDYKPNFDTGSPIPGDKFPGIEKNPGIDWGDAFNTKLPSSLTNYKRKNEWGEVFEGLFDKTKNTDKYRDEAKRSSFGEAIRGSGGQILENLGTRKLKLENLGDLKLGKYNPSGIYYLKGLEVF